MPIYSYKCDNCGVTSHDKRDVEDRNNPTPCGVCNAGTRKRKYEPSGISIEGRAYREYGGDPNDWLS